MFKKVSLLAAGAAAEFDGTSKDIALCTAQAATVDNYLVGTNCYSATIKLEGGDPPADNEATDGYKATMTVGFTGALSGNIDGVFYGICVIPVALVGTDDTPYAKAPRGMCLGINTGLSSSAAAGTDAEAETARQNGNTNVLGGTFAHCTYAGLVTNSGAVATADWTEVAIVTATVTNANLTGQASSTLLPSGCTTMSAMKTYGTIATPVAAFYTDTAGADRYGLATAVIAETTTDASAIFYMPEEAETYPDVPRLSPLDMSGWQGYAPDVATNGSMGKMLAQTLVANSVIVTGLATTVAAGVAVVGAAALAF